MNDEPKKRGGFTPEMRAKAAATRAANKAKKAAKPAPAKPATEFAGLSHVNCCEGCTPTQCVISGIGVCAHPLKGGLQAAQMQDSKTLARFNRAKETLA